MTGISRKILILIILLVFSVTILTGCSTKSHNQYSINEKVNEEIRYFENNIFTITNRYLKNEYMINDEFSWDEVKNDAVKIADTLDNMINDLAEFEISNDEIINFRNNVNNLIISVGNKDNENIINNCSLIYYSVPIFRKNIENNKNLISISELKSFILSSLAFSLDEDWESAKNSVIMAENKYNEMMNDGDFIKEYSEDLNKIYILLQEVKNAINLQEIELVKVKYLIFIEKI